MCYCLINEKDGRALQDRYFWLDVSQCCSFTISLHLCPRSDENLAVLPAYHQRYSARALINSPSWTRVWTEANREGMEMSTEVRGSTSTLRRLNCRLNLMLVLPLAIAGSSPVVFYLFLRFYFGFNLTKMVSGDWNCTRPRAILAALWGFA